MLSQILSIAANPSKAGPRLLLRLALPVAALGLLWTALVIAIGFAFVALEAWLAPHVGRAAALALTAAAGLALAAAGIAAARWRPAPARGAPLDLALVQQYPLEALTLALAAGVLASGVDGAGLARPLLDAFTRARR